MNLATPADLCVATALAVVPGVTNPMNPRAHLGVVGPRREEVVALATRALLVVRVAAQAIETHAAALVVSGVGVTTASAAAPMLHALFAAASATTVVGVPVMTAATQTILVTAHVVSTASNARTAARALRPMVRGDRVLRVMVANDRVLRVMVANDRVLRVRGPAGDTSAQEVSGAATFVVRGPGRHLATATGATSVRMTAATTATAVTEPTTAATTATAVTELTTAVAAVTSASGHVVSTVSSARTAARALRAMLVGVLALRAMLVGALALRAMLVGVLALRAMLVNAEGHDRHDATASSVARAGPAVNATGTTATIAYRVWARPAGERPTRAGARRQVRDSTGPQARGGLVLVAVAVVVHSDQTRAGTGREKARV